MADIADIANDYAERELQERLHGRVQYQGHSQKACDDCGCEIPLLRREAVPGVRLCIGCQEVEERRHG
jgi:phage/conjugal plasmid C-4 type zinc finger TraR family protein